MKKAIYLITALGLVIGISGVAHAQVVHNGSFEVNGGTGSVNFNTSLADWNVPDPRNGAGNFLLFSPGSADTIGVPAYGTAPDNLKLWGPGTGSNNGLPATSPDGGYFLGVDSAYKPDVGTISQSISGLIATHTYTITFDWAAAQENTFDGPTNSGWIVGFGSAATQSTSVAAGTILDKGFSQWMTTSFTFTADNTSDTLSFTPYGAPSGAPPFVLLDGVGISATTPEGSSLGLLSMGLLSIGGIGTYIRRKAMKSVS